MSSIDAINLADIGRGKSRQHDDDDDNEKNGMVYSKYIILLFIMLMMHTEIISDNIILLFGADTMHGRCLTNKGLFIMCVLTVFVYMLYEWCAERGYI